MSILAIDTAAAQCAVALVEAGSLRGVCREPMARGHAERLFPLIEALLAEAGAQAADISAIVVCTGPGGFSGARIGVAAARGLALALGAPAVGVDWFEALALTHQGPALVVLPASPGLVYARRFVDGAASGEIETIPAELALPAPGEALLTLDGDDDKALTLLARAGAARVARGSQPRPAPLYLRAPDALPSSAPTPTLLT